MPVKKSIPSKKTKNSSKKTAGVRKTNSETKKKPWGAIFWTAFFLTISCLFFINRNAIRRTLEQSRIAEQSYEIPEPSSNGFLPDEFLSTDIDSINAEPAETLAAGSQYSVVSASTVLNETAAAAETRDNPAVSANTTAVVPAADQAPRTADFRDRTMYFINVDRDGTILRIKVNRSLPVTDSPLTDTLSALLAGPVPDEQDRGLITLIPEGTRIMNATIRGNTAYINLNEDFQFNIYGVEGYAGALRQIVWTATEFPNVLDVQILIEGRRIDFLGEGVWIGSPVTREML